jgi:hypothetical protein
MNLSAALVCNNSSVDIASASYNWAPTVRQGCKHYIVINCSILFLNGDLHGQSLQSVLLFNITNMDAMSDWPDYFPCSCRDNIEEPAICLTVSVLSAVSQVELPSFQISTTMSDTELLNTMLLEVMISSKDERIITCDLSDHTLHFIFDAWLASINVCSKWPSPWNNSIHAPLWLFYLQCEIGETGSPGIICIVCHHDLRHPSEHGTSSWGKQLLAKAHIRQIN